MSFPQTQQNKFVNWQGDAEVRGEDFTATVTLGNPDVLVGSGRSVRERIRAADTLSLSSRSESGLNAPCCPPARCRRSALPPVRNAGPGSGRGAGVPPAAGRGGIRHVFSREIRRWEDQWIQVGGQSGVVGGFHRVVSSPCRQ